MDLPLRKREAVTAGVVGALAAVSGTVGEFLMMWSPDGGYASYGNLLYASAERSRLGFFLGVLAVPLYFLGYVMIYQALRRVPRWFRLGILGVAVYAFAAANVWLGARAILAGVVKHGSLPELVALVTELTEPVLNIVRLLIVLLSLALAYVIASGRTVFPRWFAVFSPGVLLAGVFLVFLVAPSIGNYLLPPAMNLVHLVFFTVGTYLYAGSKEVADG